MGNFNRDDRGGSRGGFQSRGRSSYGNDRGGFQPRGRSFGSDRGPREMFKAVCDNCGKDCEVPFRPTSGKPVYCSDCFEKMGGRSADRPERQERPEFRAASQNFDQSKNFEALNSKLDRIISLLEPKPEVVVEVKEEAKAPKAKKATKVAPEK